MEQLTNQPSNPNAAANASASECDGDDRVKRSKLPDFKPLGAIRDYFTEQMRQDSIR